MLNIMGSIGAVGSSSPEQVEHYSVTSEAFDQLNVLGEFPDVSCVGMMASDGQIFGVGGSDGVIPRKVAHPRWSDHIHKWPDDFPPRHPGGFVVPSRLDPKNRRYDLEFVHRIGDIYVRKELADALAVINHPAIVAVRLIVQSGLDAVVDIRGGNFPKAIEAYSEFPHRYNELILPNQEKKYVAGNVMNKVLRAFDRELPELSIPKCQLHLEGNILVAAWNIKLNRESGLRLSAFDENVFKDDAQLRNAWIVMLGRKLFASKIGGIANAFSHQLMVAAYAKDLVGSCTYEIPDMFYFCKNADGGMQICLKIKLENHSGPSGPGGGSRDTLDEDCDDFAMAG